MICTNHEYETPPEASFVLSEQKDEEGGNVDVVIKLS